MRRRCRKSDLLCRWRSARDCSRGIADQPVVLRKPAQSRSGAARLASTSTLKILPKPRRMSRLFRNLAPRSVAPAETLAQLNGVKRRGQLTVSVERVCWRERPARPISKVVSPTRQSKRTLSRLSACRAISSQSKIDTTCSLSRLYTWLKRTLHTSKICIVMTCRGTRHSLVLTLYVIKIFDH